MALQSPQGPGPRSAGDTGPHVKHVLTRSSPQAPDHTAAPPFSCTDEDTEAEPPAALWTKPDVESCCWGPRSSSSQPLPSQPKNHPHPAREPSSGEGIPGGSVLVGELRPPTQPSLRGAAPLNSD